MIIAHRCLFISVAFLCFASGAGCASTVAEDLSTSVDELSESIEPREGSTIPSAFIDPTKWYRGSRNIDILTEVGALSSTDVYRIVHRADGIIANQPANGRVGIDELVALESPAHFDTLFPDEQAAIPRVWELLRIDDAPRHAPDTLKEPELTVHDAPTPKPYNLPITALSAALVEGGITLRDIARRIELTHDSDGDPNTISGADVANAYARRGSYLPEEERRFFDIHWTIASRAPQHWLGEAYVEGPDSSESELFSAGPMILVARTEASPFIEIVGGGDPSSIMGVRLSTRVFARRSPMSYGMFTVVRIGKTMKGESLLPTNEATEIFDETRLEVWRQGKRIAEVDTAGSRQAVTQTIPFGYAMKLGTNTFGFSCDTVRGEGICSYKLISAIYWSHLVDVRPTSYTVEGHDDIRLDLFDNGRGEVFVKGTKSICYPTGQRIERSCSVLDTDGQVSMTFTYGRAGDAPALGTARIRGEFTVANLYVY